MFVEGFITALGAMAAIAAVSIVTLIVVGIPSYFYLKKNLKVWREMFDVIQRANERVERNE